MRRILRAVEIALLALAAVYAGDYLSVRYALPGHRQTLGSVQVQTLYAVRQKGNRIEYSLGDSVTQTCVRSLFPQLGYTPCWYLSRHATKRIDVGQVAPGRPGPFDGKRRNWSKQDGRARPTRRQVGTTATASAVRTDPSRPYDF